VSPGEAHATQEPEFGRSRYLFVTVLLHLRQTVALSQISQSAIGHLTQSPLESKWKPFLQVWHVFIAEHVWQFVRQAIVQIVAPTKPPFEAQVESAIQ
jgi:hypothetical protein